MIVVNRDVGEDLKLLAKAVLDNLEYKNDCEFGSIGIDCKRPFGNSDVEPDMLEIIGWEMEGDDGEDPCYSSKQREYVYKLYTEKLSEFIKENAKF